MTSKVIYGWRDGRGYKIPAQVVGEQLEALEAKHGEITPIVVVAAARPDDSPLHTFFEWNDANAAESWRREQARSLVAAVVVKAYDGEATRNPTRAFVSISDTDGRSYVGIATAMSDREMREQLLDRGRREILEWRERYRALEEFSKVFTTIDKLVAKLPGAAAVRGRRKQAAQPQASV